MAGSSMHRLSVLVPDDMVSRLKNMKRYVYYDVSQSQMMRDLIRIGLDSLEQEKAHGKT